LDNFLFVFGIKSDIVPTGQIQPQKNLPRKRVAITRIIAGKKRVEKEFVRRVVIIIKGELRKNPLVYLKSNGYWVM
jgi:hypothetical protein